MSLFSLGKWRLETSVNKYYGEMVRKCLSCIRQVNISFLCNQWFSITVQCSVQSRPLSTSLLWRHNGRDGVSNYQPHDCFYSSVYSGADQKKHQSSASLAFVRGIHWWPVNSPRKRPVTRKKFDDVIMWRRHAVEPFSALLDFCDPPQMHSIAEAVTLK